MSKIENFSWENFVLDGNFITDSKRNFPTLIYKGIYVNIVGSNVQIDSQSAQNLELVHFLAKNTVLIKTIMNAYQYGFWRLDFYRTLQFKGEHKKAIQIAFEKGKSFL